jgi:uncharacterized protein
MPKATSGVLGAVRARLGEFSHWAIVRGVIYIFALFAALILSKVLTGPFVPPSPSPMHHLGQLLANLVSAAMLLAAYVLTVRLVERRRAVEADPRGHVASFAIGCAIGVGMMGVYLILWSMGRVVFLPGIVADGLLGELAVCFAAAVLEELAMRAVVFRLVEEAAGTTVGVVVSAVLFGLLHAFNPGATLVSSAAVAIEAGVLLAVAYALTRNLWFCIGLHMSWNFAEGSLFGAKVSGGSAAHSLMHTTLAGPDILTGGAFGPEASVIAMGVTLVVSAIVATLVVRRSGWQPGTLRLRLA